MNIDDLVNLRFNKGSKHPLTFPMTDVPNYKSMMHNPGNAEPGRVPPFDFTKLLEYALEVFRVRNEVIHDIYPEWFLVKYWPKQWGPFKPHLIPEPLLRKVHNLKGDYLSPTGHSLNDRALVVEMDNPMDLLYVCIDIIKGLGEFELKGDKGKHVDFHSIVSGINLEVAVEQMKEIKECFAIKWYYGVPRPEEVLEYLIPGFNSKLFTAYKNGCPPHPSYPAGHGTYAGVILKVLLDKFKLSPDTIYTLRMTCYLWSMWRTYSGVHYGIDNVQGLLTVGGGH